MAFGRVLGGISSVVRDTSEQTFTEDFLETKPVQKVAANSGASPHIWCPDSRRVYVSLSRQHRESDLVAGRYSPHGTSDCHGELSALFRSLKRVGAFALKMCIATNLFGSDTASLGENVVLLAGPWPHVLDSVSGC